MSKLYTVPPSSSIDSRSYTVIGVKGGTRGAMPPPTPPTLIGEVKKKE